MARNGNITRNQEKAISALLVRPSVQEAAQVIDVSERTLWRWLEKPQFQEAYRRARRQAVSHAVAQLQRITSEAVQTLSDVMQDRGATSSARVSASRAVLELAIKAVEIEDLEVRISELEEVARRG